MKAILGGVYNRRKIPCYIYGFGRKLHPHACQIRPESLNWSKVLANSNENRNFSNHLCHNESPAFRGLDLRRLSTFDSVSHQCIANYSSFAILPQKRD